MPNKKWSELTEALVAADTDQVVGFAGPVNFRMKGSTLRGLTGLRGVWDVTGVAAPAVPLSSTGVTVAATASPEEFNATFVNAISGDPKFTGSGVGPAPVAAQWQKFVVPADDVGDNSQGVGVMFVNGNATDADIIASFAGFPTLVGTVTLVAVAFAIPGGLRGFYVVDTTGIQGGQISGGLLAGDTIYLGVDSAGFSCQINATPPAVTSYAIASATLRAGFLGLFTADPAVLLDSPILFSLGTTDAGKTPFSALADAAPPAYPPGTLNGTRWLVQNTGTFNGKALADGDVAEFFNNATEVIVTPATPLSVAAVNALVDAATAAAFLAYDPVPLILSELTRGMGVVTNYQPTPPNVIDDFDAYIVAANPTGDWSAFAPGSLAAGYDGAWVNIPRAKLLGIPLTFRSLSFNSGTGEPRSVIANCPSDNGQSQGQEAPYISNQGLQTFPGGNGTESDLRATGWILEPPFGSPGLRTRKLFMYGISTLTVGLDDCGHQNIIIDTDPFTLTITVPGAFNAANVSLLAVSNAAATPVTFQFAAIGGAHLLAPGETALFRISQLSNDYLVERAFSAETITNALVPVSPGIGAGWYVGSIAPTENKKGDRVYFRGRIEATMIPGAIIATTSFPPPADLIFPVWIATSTVGFAVKVNTFGDLVVEGTPPAPGLEFDLSPISYVL